MPSEALPLTSSGAFSKSKFRMDMDMPEVYSIGLSYRLNPRTNLYADSSFTRWSSFDESVVSYKNPAQPTISSDHGWEDVWRFALGGEYKLSSISYLSFGVSHDESPIPSGEVGAMIPENDSWMFSIGYGLEISKDISIDLAYVKYIFDDVHVQDYSTESGLLKGEYEMENDALGVQLNWSF